MSAFEKIVDIANLKLAFKQSYKVERTRYSSDYALLLPFNLASLQHRLISGTWKPHSYKTFKVYEPKERLVSKAHFEDRIVHHAYHNVLEPIAEKVFSPYSAATRKGKGINYALDLVTEFIERYDYFLKFDVRHYFDSIDHKKMLEILRKYTDDERVHNLETLIVNNARDGEKEGVGLPIGNLTSQFWANVYLNELDGFLSSKGFGFVRYMDDTLVFSNDVRELKALLRAIKGFLEKNLSLTLKHQVTLIGSVNMTFPFLGRVLKRGEEVRLRRENKKRLKKHIDMRVWEYEHGVISYNTYFQSLASLEAMLK